MSFLVRRVRSSWLLLACVAVTVLLATGLMTVLWAFAAQTAPAGALSILASPQGRLIALNGLANAGQAASDSQFIRATLRKAWPGVGFQMESALWADPIQLPSLATNASTPPASSLNEPTPTASASVQIQPAFLDGFSAHATLTTGTWPSPPHRRGLLPVALPVAVASRLHLAPGSVLTGTLSGGTPTSLQVTGLFRPRNPASPYWALDMLPVSGIFVQGHSITYAGLAIDRASISYGPALVNPAALGASQASWLVLPTASSMARGNIGELATSTNAAVSKLATSILPYGLQVTSGLPQLLTGIGSTIVLTRSLFAIAALQLLLVAGPDWCWPHGCWPVCVRRNPRC